MEYMRRFCVFYIFGAMLFSEIQIIWAQAPHFSELYVLGDSLSDIGNFPESPSFNDTSFYVPFSNPVDTASGNATPPTLGLNTQIPWPKLEASDLSVQVPTDNRRPPRRYRSFNWTELFLYYAKQQGLTSSPHLLASERLAEIAAPLNASINYAWGSALSILGCANDNFQPFAHCNRRSTQRTRAYYLKKPTSKRRLQIRIPGVQRQAQFFIRDYDQGRIHPDHHSLYVVWIGGNDLINAYNQLIDFKISPMLSFLIGKSAQNGLDALDRMMSNLPSEKRPQKLYFFNLMNPALTPAYYGSRLGTLGHALVWIYNHSLSLRVYWHNHFYPYQVYVVSVNTWYEEASQSPYFKKNLGERCQERGGDYHSPTHIPASNCHGFLYWNEVHPAVDMQKITAYRFLSFLKKSSE